MKISRNLRVVFWLILGGIGMGGLAYASVPLYRLFCQVTGFNGTTQVATDAPPADVKPTNVKVRVRFDTNTNAIDWSFKPATPYVDITVGKTALVEFTVKNHASRPVTGRAVYNVLPESMGAWFMKMQCFCFTDQTLQAGEEKVFPMLFYIDPQMLTDEETATVRDLTLSYTFFEAKAAKK